jgi:hypothetical protein
MLLYNSFAQFRQYLQQYMDAESRFALPERPIGREARYIRRVCDACWLCDIVETSQKHNPRRENAPQGISCSHLVYSRSIRPMNTIRDDRPILPALRPRRLTVSGGSRLREENARFCRHLGRRLAQESGITIITGGLKFLREHPELKSTDWTTMEGMLSYLKEKNIDLHARIETILPAEMKDWAEVERFEEGHIVRLYRRTPEARRFMLVSTADAVLTVEGGKGTRQVIDLALVIGKPVLPLPFTKGYSEERWKENKDEIGNWFDVSDEVVHKFENASLEGANDDYLHEMADLVVRHLVRGLRRNCFVMMPFSEAGNTLFDSVIYPAVVQLGIIPVRADRLNLTGDALQTLRQAIDNCDGALADITGSNPNVMYELGLAHAQNKPVVIICEYGDARRLESLPFDLRNHHVIGYGEDKENLKKKIQASLKPIFGEEMPPNKDQA